jgi:hypothetical protein
VKSILLSLVPSCNFTHSNMHDPVHKLVVSRDSIREVLPGRCQASIRDASPATTTRPNVPQDIFWCEMCEKRDTVFHLWLSMHCNRAGRVIWDWRAKTLDGAIQEYGAFQTKFGKDADWRMNVSPIPVVIYVKRGVWSSSWRRLRLLDNHYQELYGGETFASPERLYCYLDD